MTFNTTLNATPDKGDGPMATDINTITFGVEIECYIPAAAMAAAGWVLGGYHSGRQIPGLPVGWNAQSDCSLHSPPAGFRGIEVVSPVLRGAEGLEQVRAVVAKVKEMGGQVNHTCGLHVHVGFPENFDALRRLVNLTSHYEKALYASTGTTSREFGSYCQSIKSKLAPLKTGVTHHKLRMVARGHGDRYHVLNLTNLVAGVRPAVEYRCFAGTLNFTKVAAAVMVSVGLVQKALDSKAAVAWDASTETNKKYDRGHGERAVARLVGTLGWKRDGGQQFGLLLPDMRKDVCDVLFRLAKKYDGRATAA
jgi:hypothetical protein